MSKPQEIKGLEKLYNIELEELEYGSYIYETCNSYQLNDNRVIIGLNLSCNGSAEIKGMEAFPNLQTLIMSDNRISRIHGLDSLTQLRELILSGNRISEMTGLDALVKLTRLDLSRNQIAETKVSTSARLRSAWLSLGMLGKSRK